MHHILIQPFVLLGRKTSGEDFSFQAPDPGSGALAERFDRLTTGLAFLAHAIPNFQRLVIQYLDETPLSFVHPTATDSENMLTWLQRRKSLSSEQLDFVASERARIAVETQSLLKQSECAEFFARQKHHEEFFTGSATEESGEILLNPIRIWTKFHTRALLDDHIEPPANVVFFAGRHFVLTACLDLEGQVLVNELADFQPCTLQQWQASTAFRNNERLQDFVVDLARLGLVAFGRISK